MTGWTIFLCLVAVGIVLVGFAWRMGYEFSKLRKIVSKARYLSIYGYQIALEPGMVRIHCTLSSQVVSFAFAYPTILTLVPFAVVLPSLIVDIEDVSEETSIRDFSDYKLEFPTMKPWVRKTLRFVISACEPCVRVLNFEYSYKSSTFSSSPLIAKFTNSSLDISNMRFVTEERATISVSTSTGFRRPNDSCLISIDRFQCRLNPHNFEVDVSCETVSVHYSVHDTVQGLIDRMTNLVNDHSLSPLIPSQSKLRFITRIQSQVQFVMDSVTSNSSMEVCMSTKNGAKNMSSSSLRGIYANIEMDPFSGFIYNFAIHNFNDSRNNRTVSSLAISSILRVQNIPILHANFSNVNTIIDSSQSGGNEWNCSTRIGAIQVAVLSVDPSTHRVCNLKQISVVGNSARGLSVSVTHIEIDASPRMLNRLVRVYSKLTGLVGGESLPNLTCKDEAAISSFTPLVIADRNYLLMQKKFFSSPSTTLQRSESSSTIGGGLNDSTMSSSRDLKNWRYMERIQSSEAEFSTSSNSVNSRLLCSIVSGTLRIDMGNDLFTEMSTIKLTMKTSSIGTNFTSFNCDSVVVNDNIKSDATSSGFRIWIDGDLLSDQSRVFCLVPPVAIRFDPKFAGIVERYFLDVAEALKGMSKISSSSTTARKMIEVLQVSSLQLELHAKEMLGVLSLDKAVINLNKSSVYKSNGFLDAVNSLATQYRADVTSQWLSLLMRLDVSIGRPMSTARKLIGSISGLFVNGSADGTEE
jgi:hypothetical protein